MASPGIVGASSTGLVVQTLKWIRKQGFKPVALRKQSKAAIDEKYVDPNYQPPGDELWGVRDLGIGAVTGPKHSGPIDIDLDCQEAIFFAPRFLPHTPAVFGRKSKSHSHYLYRVETDEFHKRALVDPVAKATIIEMRGDGGHQTVFPGSLHEDTGEIIEWSELAFPDVPRVDATLLEFAVKKIAIATMIVRHMWSDGQRNEINKHLAGMFYYLDWPEDDVKSLILAVMEYTGDTDRTRVRTVSSTYKKGEKGGKITGSNSLKEFLGDPRVVDRILEWAGSESVALLQDYNERYAVVSVKGRFRIAETIPVRRGDPPVLFAKDDFLNMMATDTINVQDDKGRPKRVGKAAVWLSNPRRRTYRGVDFIPGAEDTSPILNLWTGWALDPSPDYSCRAWLDLLYYIICGQNDEVYKWMLNWFANIVREPLNKPLTAPVIIGRQGAGKSLLFSYFGKILGPSYTVVTNDEHVYGRFNKHLATTLLLHSEEALFGGEKKHRNTLKSLITDEHRQYEPKGVDAEQVKNYLRLAMTSNEPWAAPAEVDDRRFTVIDMDIRKADTDLIKAILQELKDDRGPSSLFHYLLNMEYDSLIPKINIKNDALMVMKQINFDPIVGWWQECLKTGLMLPDFLWWAGRPERSEWPEVVSAHALYIAMTMKMRERGQRYIPDQTQFSMQMTRMIGTLDRKQRYFQNPMSDDAPREVKQMSSKQYAITNMPTLDYCREAFAKFMGQQMIWPLDADPADRPPHERF